MKKLNNTLFKKFEPNKINNLAKIVGGAVSFGTEWDDSDGNSGCDFFASNSPCTAINASFKDKDGNITPGDIYFCDCWD
jgi:hypothetical protein